MIDHISILLFFFHGVPCAQPFVKVRGRFQRLWYGLSLGLHVAHSCKQSTRSRKPHIDITPFRQVWCIV